MGSVTARPNKKGKAPSDPVKDRQIADRVARARVAKPPRGTEYYVACRELADRLGLDAGDVMDEFDDRAGTREYLGDVTRAEAEKLAMQDVLERFDRQAELPKAR